MGKKPDVLISIVVPVFNEESVVSMTNKAIFDVFKNSKISLEVIYINDGSTDLSLEVLLRHAEEDKRVKVIELSRNFGHQRAVTAGLNFASGDAVIVLDADLQDPPEVCLEMIKQWQIGYDVAYGVRRDRKEGPLKVLAYKLFYMIYRSLAHIDAPLDSGDFCLMDRQVVNKINSLPEYNRFVRGLRSWVGFKQVAVPYERAARAAGESKYSFFKLVSLAFDGLINFSLLPLRFFTIFGLSCFLASVGLIFLLLIQRIWSFPIWGYSPQDVPGYLSLALGMLALGGIQLLGLGVVGEYVGRIYMETKCRPQFIVKNTINLD